MSKPALHTQAIVGNYLDLAHQDYRAARHMLRSGFLEHGAMLASTAVEKYLKAVIGASGIHNSDHLGGTLYKLVAKHQPDLSTTLDKDFLKFLEKAYKLRYASASSPGLSIIINQYRTLMTLDRLIAEIDRGFQLSHDANAAATPYQAGVKREDPELLLDNVAIDPPLVLTLMQSNNKVVELKVEDDFSTMRAEYETMGVNAAGSFTRLPEISTKKNEFTLSRG